MTPIARTVAVIAACLVPFLGVAVLIMWALAIGVIEAGR